MTSYIPFSMDIYASFIMKHTVMRPDLISRVKRIQMGPNPQSSTCVKDKTDLSKVVTGVVPATTSLMPKSEWKDKYFLQENRIVVSRQVFIKILMYLLLTIVGALYRLPWILAIVGG